jgi:hypothetical protein
VPADQRREGRLVLSHREGTEQFAVAGVGLRGGEAPDLPEDRPQSCVGHGSDLSYSIRTVPTLIMPGQSDSFALRALPCRASDVARVRQRMV